MPTARFYTLGCRLNQSESAVLAKSLEHKGYTITERQDNADLCIINTCTVTTQADAKCRQLIRSAQQKNPHALIAVIGCFSQMASEQILSIGGVHLVLGTQEKMALPQYLDWVKQSDEPIVAIGKISQAPFQYQTFGQVTSRTRANLKIQDGCSFFCSFCIIPYARGLARPRKWENLLNEAKQLADLGYRELVLTGVNVGTYYESGKGLLAVVDALEQIDGIERIRISSIEPTTFTHHLFEKMAAKDSKLVPFLHLPLQSGADSILKSMRRKYCLAEYQNILHKAQQIVPNIGMGTDVIVGFPGETNADFEATVEALTNLPVHYFHVFPYAARQKTTALQLPNKVPAEIINQRVQVLRRLSTQKRLQYYQSFVKNSVEVLFEEQEAQSHWLGYSANYMKVRVKSAESLHNQIRCCVVQSATESYAEACLA